MTRQLTNNDAVTAVDLDVVIDVDLLTPSDRSAGHVQPSRHGTSGLKRAFDLLFATVAILVTLPLTVTIAVLLWIEAGSAIFVQPRAGQGLQRFGCLKFRTMVPDAAARLNALLDADPAAAAEFDRCGKLKRDPRITPLGRFLRKTSLDELPQFFNVLRGDMSVVGPRPITLREINLYGPDLAGAMQVKPGVTGLWQVSGRSDVDYFERIRLDLEYVQSASLRADLAIIARTVKTVLVPRGNGAY